MKNPIVKHLRILALGGVSALVLTACGGGGNGITVTPLTITGVAATGAALANAAVSVTCPASSGVGTVTGTATANASGSYTVTVNNAKAPCIIVASTPASGSTPAVQLTSIVPALTSSGGTLTAVANVTPLTTAVVDTLVAAKVPGASLSGSTPTVSPLALLNSGNVPTTTDVTTAVTTTVAAVNTVLSSIGAPTLPVTSTNLLSGTLNTTSSSDPVNNALDSLGAVKVISSSGTLAPAVVQAVVTTVTTGVAPTTISVPITTTVNGTPTTTTVTTNLASTLTSAGVTVTTVTPGTGANTTPTGTGATG